VGVRCFFVEPTDRCRRWLRRYVSSITGVKCSGSQSYHNAMTFLDEISRPFDETKHAYPLTQPTDVPHDDPRWPVKCEGCDYAFQPGDEWQDFTRQVYVDRASGRFHTLNERTPGMMWSADWYHDDCKGEDGRCLVVICPNGHEWMIDSHASNCTMPNDTGPFATAHRCWCRHGVPPNITVDKIGRTCNAGGGSIQAGNYHGFLRNGEFVP
jgi:hypothetical protein